MGRQAFRQGVVSVANPYGAEAGAKMLEQGGNAIDAAVAIAYALNVVEPQSAGIGGGGFMMIHLAGSGETFSIDTREKAPAGAARDMFVGVTRPDLNGISVGVPGMVRGTALALEKHGRLPLAQVLQPAIRLAQDGFAATPRFVASPNCLVTANNRARNSPASSDYFCPRRRTDRRRRHWSRTSRWPRPSASSPRTARTASTNACPTRAATSPWASSRARPSNRPQASGGKGGSMTLADLEAYQSVIRAPIEGSYRGYRIKAMAPPSSGALTVIQILRMLERFPLGDAAAGYGFGSTRTLNVMADAMRVAFSDRADWMADADFVPVPTKGLIDPTYLSERSNLIVPGSAARPTRCPATRGRSRPRGSRRPRRWPRPRPSPARRTAPRTSRWWTNGATSSPTPTPSSRATASASSPATRSPTARFATTASCSTTS